MKKFKLQFPKLKHPTLCLLFFHFFAIIMLPIAFLAEWADTLFGTTFAAIIVIASMILAFINIIVNVVYFKNIYELLYSVQAWQRARLWYETDVNGKTRTEVETNIKQKINAKGTSHATVQGYFPPICVQYVLERKRSVFLQFISEADKICLLYSVDRLDAALYKQIMASARKNASPLVKDARKRMGFRLAVSVIILADNVEESLLPLKVETKAFQDEIFFPCIIDLSSGRYYFDALKISLLSNNSHIKNIAISLTIKMLFGGRPPLKGNENFLEWGGVSLETSLWDHMRKIHVTEGEASETLPYFIPSNTVVFHKNYLYFKTSGKTVAWEYTVDEKDEHKIHVISSYSFYIKPHYQSMSKPERLAIQKYVAADLSEKGYTVLFH